MQIVNKKMGKDMKILFIQDKKICPNAGGLERVTYILSQEFHRRGHDIKYLSVGDNPGVRDENKDTEFDQFYLNYNELDPSKFREAYEKLLKEEKIELAIFQDVGNTVVNVLEATPKEIIRYIVFHNQPFPHLYKERKVMSLTPTSSLSRKRKILKLICILSERVYRKIYRRHCSGRYAHIERISDRFVMLCESSKERIIHESRGMIRSEGIDAINNPITFAPKEIDPSTKENLIMFVGRLTNPQKNVTGFIDVWKKFSELHPDWEAVILGDGEHRDLITQYAERQGVNNLEFKGNVKNIADYYKRAKILCMTSAYEGWPMVLMEAMSFGCIPVAYDTFEAVHEIITDWKDGVIIEKFDTVGMAKGLDELSRNDCLLKNMANASKEKIERFSVENIADQWEERFKKDKTEKDL